MRAHRFKNKIDVNQTKGFTIVELLIVVVVIAILAAITIVSYNGITASAVKSTMKTDIVSLGKYLEIYKIENGKYPMDGVPVSDPAPELEKVLRSSGFYSVTRATSPDGVLVTKVAKSFIFCWSRVTGEYIVVSGAPYFDGVLSSNLGAAVGKGLMYYSTKTGFGEAVFTYNTVGGDTSMNVCKSVDPNFEHSNDYDRRWSFDIPTQKAQ